ncbi:MAG: hypothetical protein AAF960_28370 [Bacteroidota bacterium]
MTLSKLLHNIVSPYVPAGIVDDSQFGQIIDRLEGLPEKLTSFFGFECPLHTNQPVADFLLCVFADEYGRDILSGKTGTDNIPADWLSDEVWRKVHRFAQAWNTPTNELFYKADNIWLEFDIIDQEGQKIPQPSFFFAPYHQQEKKFLKGAESQAIVRQGLQLVRGKSYSAATSNNIDLLYKHLPKEAYVFQVGSMLARKEDTYRICIRDITIESIPVFLTQVGWIGDMDALKTTLQILGSLVDRIDLDLDVGTTIGSKIGLECYQLSHRTYTNRWEQFLVFLEKQKLCVPAKRKSLLAYRGVIHPGMVGLQNWPSHLQQLLGLFQGKYYSLFVKNIHHVKVNFEHYRLTKAKAYLGVRHIWQSVAKLNSKIEASLLVRQ